MFGWNLKKKEIEKEVDWCPFPLGMGCAHVVADNERSILRAPHTKVMILKCGCGNELKIELQTHFNPVEIQYIYYESCIT